MEKFTQEVGGYPFLYADIFMTREEFEKMFDLTGQYFLFLNLQPDTVESFSEPEVFEAGLTLNI